MRLICAPMATLSHEAFRRTAERFPGCDEYFTEMINAPSLLNMGPFEKYYLMSGPCPEKIVWQLTGNKAEPMAQAAEILASKGGLGIDLNMGCSAPQIYKTGAGISWMLKPISETEQLVKSVRKAIDDSGTKLRLSVKCRLGADDFTDETFFSFTDMLFDCGVDMITLHPRTVKEKLRGLPRYDYAEKLALRNPDKEIVVNGEIRDASSLKIAMGKVPHAKAAMIGRAAAQKPWIFSSLKKNLAQDENQDETLDENPGEEKIDAMETALFFLKSVMECQPEEFWRTRIQRFFSYYCDNFSFGHYFKMQLLNFHSVEETEEKIRKYFDQCPDDRWIKSI
ncbi:MAG: tRNA-dihydrouridine synthase family protein [Treponema sp.]|nr:tRNA-dihydrouridine synthase family protein [Treponema sp.]